MTAIGRALMRVRQDPVGRSIDGLAPQIVEESSRSSATQHEEHVSFLLAEQNRWSAPFRELRLNILENAAS